MSLRFERAVFLILLVAAALLFASTFAAEYDTPSFGGDVSTVFTPRIFLGLVLVLSAAAFFGRRPAAEEESAGDGFRVARLLAVVAIVAIASLALPHAGFVLVMTPCLFLFCWTFGYRKIVTLSAISVLGVLAIWFLFNGVLELPLPRSPWFGAF